MDVCETEIEPEKDAIIYIRPDFKAKCCHRCGKGRMQVIMRFRAHAPPSQDILNSLINNTLKR
jgi:hypothetical protein